MESQQKIIRGKNFTSEDRSLLLSLVESKKNIVECKRTNKVSSEAKKEAWSYIATMYNAGSTVLRTADQLKTLYANIKRETKKDVAKQNKDRYLDSIHSRQLDDELVELRERARQEKKEIHQTGGGTFNKSLTESDHRMLSLLGDNIRPWDNPYDDATIYFANPIPFPQEANPIITQAMIHPASTSIMNQEIDPAPVNNDTSPLPMNVQLQEPHSSYAPAPQVHEKKKTRRRQIIRKKRNFLSPKDRYYLVKLENAKIEQEILKIRLEKEKKGLAS